MQAHIRLQIVRAGALEPVTALLEHPTRAVRVAAIVAPQALVGGYGG